MSHATRTEAGRLGGSNQPDSQTAKQQPAAGSSSTEVAGRAARRACTGWWDLPACMPAASVRRRAAGCRLAQPVTHEYSCVTGWYGRWTGLPTDQAIRQRHGWWHRVPSNVDGSAVAVPVPRRVYRRRVREIEISISNHEYFIIITD
jgi:hypothetical protein